MVFVLRGDLDNSCPFDIQPAFAARPNRRRGRGDQPFTHRVLVYGNCGIPGEVAPVERNLATVYAPMLKEVSNGLGAVNLTSDEEEKVRELIIELRAIYDRAVNRDN